MVSLASAASIFRGRLSASWERPLTEDSTRPDDGESRGVGWVISQGALFAFFLVAVFLGDSIDGLPGLIYVQSFGLLVSVFGAFFSGWSLMAHGWNVSPFPKPVEGAVLVDSGPYRYVRHPMYTGIVVFILGVGLAYANPTVLTSSLTFLVFFVAKTGREEEMLVGTLDGYRKYRSAVPWRIIPYIV